MQEGVPYYRLLKKPVNEAAGEARAGGVPFRVR